MGIIWIKILPTLLIKNFVISFYSSILTIFSSYFVPKKVTQTAVLCGYKLHGIEFRYETAAYCSVMFYSSTMSSDNQLARLDVCNSNISFGL